MPFRRGSIQIPPDGPRDVKLDKLVAHTGYKSVPALLGVVAGLIAQVPPRQFYRLLGVIEAELSKIRREEGTP